MDEPGARRFQRAFERVTGSAGLARLRRWERARLTLPQVRVLYEVAATPGITTGELARTLGVTASTVSGLVIRLVESGLLARTEAPADRRQTPLRLTDTGTVIVGAAAALDMSRTVAALGPHLVSVTEALERLGEAIAATVADRPPGAPE